MQIRTLLSALLLASLPTLAMAQDAPATKQAYRVLLVGNSFTYANNLPALLRAVGASQGKTIETETWAAPNGTLAERWRDGHAADALRNRSFDVVVLQEIGGQVGCLTSASQSRTAPCAASLHAHEEFAKLAGEHGARVLLFTDWARDERAQGRIKGGMRKLAKETNAKVFDAAGAIEAMRKAQPTHTPYPDGSHPSIQASLTLALALYRDVAGATPTPKDLRVAAVLLPPNTAVSPAVALEAQPGMGVDRNVTVVPTSLVEPLVKALPDPSKQDEDEDPRRRRGR